VNKHKTKALGIVTVALGFVQAYPGLTELLNPKAYAWTMFVIGLGVTVCGFLNSQQEIPDANDQAG
jgi:hypothetical protein